jgi:predicted nucleic acid-binding protein
VITLDTSVVMKWSKPGERYEAEARDLRQRIERGEIEAVLNETVSLELVRGLKRTQVQQPTLGITDLVINNAFNALADLVQRALLLEVPVSDVKVRAKEIIMTLGLFMADALQLATAVHLQTQYFVVDDRHFLTPPVQQYAAPFGVQVVNLPDLIAALGPAGSGPTPPTP